MNDKKTVGDLEIKRVDGTAFIYELTTRHQVVKFLKEEEKRGTKFKVFKFHEGSITAKFEEGRRPFYLEFTVTKSATVKHLYKGKGYELNSDRIKVKYAETEKKS